MLFYHVNWSCYDAVKMIEQFSKGTAEIYCCFVVCFFFKTQKVQFPLFLQA